MTRNSNFRLLFGRHIWRGVLLFFFVISGTACEQAPVASPPPTQQVINVVLPSSLDPLKAALQRCAADQPGIALFIGDPNSETASPSNLEISLGAAADPAGYAAPLAVEDLVIVLNQANRLDGLAANSLRSLYNGQITKWDVLGNPLGAVQVWDYPVSDPLHHLFDQGVLKGSLVTSLAFIAPTPADMLEALSANPASVGYLPHAWLTDNKVYAADLDPDTQAALHLPVLALASAEPQGALRTFVACLQTGKGHNLIMQHYQPAKP